MTDLRHKSVLITGAASGLGRLLTHKIASEGAHVIAWDIDEHGLDDLRTEVDGISTYQCDVSDRAAVYAAAEKVLANQGPVDVLINNAGVVTGKPVLEATDDEIRRTFDINTLAHFWTVRAFLPAMIERNAGHIATIASAAGLVGSPKLTDYSASKFAAIGFDEALRIELKQRGLDIKTTVICPFFVRTGMFEGVKTRFSWLLPLLAPEYVADRIVKSIKSDRRRVIMPRFAYIVSPLRALPVRWFDALVDFFGVSRSMDEFTGRSGAGDEDAGR